MSERAANRVKHIKGSTETQGWSPWAATGKLGPRQGEVSAALGWLA